ncbi:methyltransferase domain-containing protein [Legionella impletisoli]|uniref:Methyltransferase n=1 Tax=Legionella impletisoli TaxID=343510 RepID=A0A917JLV0_9GAMM|nr:methyltransferase domain-containing protein [Legionella impletisoli]GGI75939.1 methyltransferase [Legionella impletisoli]
MATDALSKQYRSLDDWFETSQGERVAHAFAKELTKHQQYIYGKSLLQLGNCGDNIWLKSLHFYCKWITTPYLNIHRTSLLSSIQSLPFEKNSLDCLIAPFTFEVLTTDKNLIVEIDRILKPSGYVIFFGINPWSFWGASVKWGNIEYLGHAVKHLTSSFTVKRILLNLGYSQYLHHSFYYIPPVSKEKYLHKLEFFNEIGKMLWPFPAGFYCLILQKKEYALSGLLPVDEQALQVGGKPSMSISGNVIHQ